MSESIVRVAVAIPLYRLFDYRLAAGEWPLPGCRVLVPLGKSAKIGVVIECVQHSECPSERLKPVTRVLDERPLLGPDDLALLQWAADYYHHPLGVVVATAIPARLRHRVAPLLPDQKGWRITAKGREQLARSGRRAARQAAVLTWLAQHAAGCAAHTRLADAVPAAASALRALREKGCVEQVGLEAAPDPVDPRESGLALNAQQREAVATVTGALGQFAAILLDGVTGSGKTEVYLRSAATALERGQGVLVLVPEIALTPQLLRRFRERLGATVRVIHSGLSDSDRERAWHRLRLGLSRVLLGTRSALFTPIPDLGLIVVDEEHDPSFKQSEGFRYSARDLAVLRAQRSGCPVLLGSATPALETLRHALSGRYGYQRLEQRAGTALQPRTELIDLRHQPVQRGLSALLLDRLAGVVAAGEQAMLFLNRRGFAPVLTCFGCGWVSDCPRCDARRTLHKANGLLWCHHCGAQSRPPEVCPACGSADLHPLGQGTEQLEEFLVERFADAAVIRIDRDSTSGKGGVEQQLSRLDGAGAAILVGTQMLAKGHHFPMVTLVGVVNADSGLYSADFRATERLAQLLVQVAGRAGRGERPGTVLIQTRYPDHPLLQTVVRQGYAAFARQALAERELAAMPPFSHQALLRAEAIRVDDAGALLDAVAARIRRYADAAVDVWGPVPAPMLRRAGKHRVHLLLQSTRRESLHGLLRLVPDWIGQLPEARRARWSLDVDPVDLY